MTFSQLNDHRWRGAPKYQWAMRGLASSLALLGWACAQQHDVGDGSTIGIARIALTKAPADAHCLRLTIEGRRNVELRFDLTPGEGSVFTLDRLPLGDVTFTGYVYEDACSAVVRSSVPTWLSEPVATVLKAWKVAEIVLKMRRNSGEAEISVDFEEGPDGGASEDAAVDAATDAGSPSARIDIYFPSDGLTYADSITVRGAVSADPDDPITEVRVNGSTAGLGVDGSFQTSVHLPLPSNVVEVVALNGQGKTVATSSVTVARSLDWRTISDVGIEPDGSVLAIANTGFVARIDATTGLPDILREPQLRLIGYESRAPDYPPTWTSYELFNLRGLVVDPVSGLAYALAAQDRIVDGTLRSEGHYPMPTIVVGIPFRWYEPTARCTWGPCQEENTGGDLTVDPTNGHVLRAKTALQMLVVTSVAGPGGVGVETPFNGAVVSVALTDDGRLLALSSFGALWAVSLADGSATVLSGASSLDASGAIAFDATHRRILLGRGTSVLAIDPSTGQRSVVSAADVGEGPPLGSIRSIVADDSGSKAIVNSELGLTAIDLATGDRTRLIAQASFGPPSEASCATDDGGSSSRYEYSVDPALGEYYSYGDSFFHASYTSSGQPEDVAAQGAVLRTTLATGEQTIVSDSKSGIGSGPPLWQPVAIEVDAAEQRALVTDAAARTLYWVALSNGDRAVLSAGDMRDASFRPMDAVWEGDTIVVVDPIGNLFTIDADTGARTLASGRIPSTGEARGTGPIGGELGPVCHDVIFSSNWVIDLISGDRIKRVR